jgi:predicted RNase H-like HicB family nuclease
MQVEYGRKVMTEKNYVVNVKTAKGTIVTARGDSAEELIENIEQLVKQGAAGVIATLEAVLTGAPQEPPSYSAVDTVVDALGGTVVQETSFAPVPPPAYAAPAQSIAGTRTCSHGTMVTRKGSGPKGEWKGYFCPTPKGTADQCTPQWVTKKDPEWNTI